MANYLGLRSKTLFSISLTLLIVAAIASCSTKRNTAISRAYHRTTARFNFYFNAEQAYNAGVEAATTKVKLDYALSSSRDSKRPQRNAEATWTAPLKSAPP